MTDGKISVSNRDMLINDGWLMVEYIVVISG